MLKPFMPYIYGLVLLVFLGLGGTALYYKYQLNSTETEIVSLKNEVDNAKSIIEGKDREIKNTKKELAILEKTVVFHQEQITQLRKDKEVTDDLLKQVLKRNQSWSSTALPDELRQHLKVIQGRSTEARVSP